MIVNFLAPNTDQVTGGLKAIYEFASGLARRGHDVNLVHMRLVGPDGQPVGRPISGPQDITWCTLDPQIRHVFLDAGATADQIPAAEVLFSWDGQISWGADRGEPVVLVQAFSVLADWLEGPIYSAVAPKLCTSRWLRQVAIAHGVPEHQAMYVPYGIDLTKYRVTRDLTDRPRRVAMLYNNHHSKRPMVGIAAIERAKEAVPDLEAVVYGNTGLCAPIPDWISYVVDPPQSQLVDEIYNGSQVFLSPSLVEGFGLAAVEAMASGCALVSTRNGGSEDYAVHEQTALVCEPDDVETMADHICTLLLDDERRIEIARRGIETVARFDWDTSAAVLEPLLEAYRSDPARYQQPNGSALYERAELLDVSILTLDD
jgi:L-malate glycosyltransferase